MEASIYYVMHWTILGHIIVENVKCDIGSIETYLS